MKQFHLFISGIPCAFFVVLIPITASAASLADPLWFFLHYFSCFAPFLASPIYHLFMCHQNGQDSYKHLLTLDVCGIWAINAFGALCGIRATFYCLPFWQFLSLTVYLVISSRCLYFIVIANNAKERFRPFAVFGVMRYFFAAVRLSFYYFNVTKNSVSAMPYYLSMDLLAFIGGALNVARIPERWFPGKCDIIGNSHQIMHVVTVLSVICLHIGSVRDFHWMSETLCMWGRFWLAWCSTGTRVTWMWENWKTTPSVAWTYYFCTAV